MVGSCELGQLLIEEGIRQHILLVVVILKPLLPIGKDDFAAQFQQFQGFFCFELVVSYFALYVFEIFGKREFAHSFIGMVRPYIAKSIYFNAIGKVEIAIYDMRGHPSIGSIFFINGKHRVG